MAISAKSFASAKLQPVLDRVTFSVERGETVAVTGPSGCGKTTLLNLVARLDRDFKGRIDIEAGTRLAYVFQEPRLLPWRTVAQNLELVLPAAPEASARVAAALQELGLGEAADVYASRLSLGMARRVALARAFIREPGLLLLDEPFVSLDEPTAGRLRRLLLGLLERRRTTTVFVTHHLGEAVMLAHRLIFLSQAPATILAEHRIPLSAAERRDPAAVERCRARLLADDPRLRAIFAPPTAAGS